MSCCLPLRQHKRVDVAPLQSLVLGRWAGKKRRVENMLLVKECVPGSQSDQAVQEKEARTVQEHAMKKEKHLQLPPHPDHPLSQSPCLQVGIPK